MRLGYFTMPVHPLTRDWSATLREDREAIELADRLDFHDAFVGEHLTDAMENIPSSLMFLATLIHSTKQIRLGTGTSNLPQWHPAVLAAHIALFDHLSNGRLVLGVSPGALASDAEALGILDQDRREMFAQVIDVLLEIWKREAPYDIDLPGNRYKVSTRRSSMEDLGIGTLPKPLQTPWPEIVGTVLMPFSKGVIAMGERDFHPLSANFLLSKWLRSHWQNYQAGKNNAGQVAKAEEWRIARTIFVADDDRIATRYAKEDPGSPYRFYYNQLREKLYRTNRLFVLKSDREQADEEITDDYVLDNLVIHGSVNKVVDQLLELREETGAFGEIVYAGLDWVDPDLAKRSMVLMAEQVMPRVNAEIRGPVSASA